MELIELEYVKIFDAGVKVLLPICSKDVSESVIKLKYPSALRPQIIKTNQEENIDFTFNMLKQNIPEEQLMVLLSMIKSNIMKQHSGFKFNEEITRDDKNKNVVWVEYEAPAIDGVMYYIMALIKLDKVIVQAIYNCQTRNRENWKKVMLRSINSIRSVENE